MSRALGSLRLIGADALYEGERAVLALSDAGEPLDTIVAATGTRRRRVQQIISTFSMSDPASRDDERRARLGSLRLVAAIAATGRRFA